MTDTADSETRREDRIPIDLNQPIVLEVHNPDGDVTVRGTDRTDVLISHSEIGSSGDLGDEESDLIIDAHQNRIEVRVNSVGGTGWAGIAGDVDLDAVVGQITRAFRRGGHWSSAKPGKARVAAGRHAWSDITIEVPQMITGRIGVHTASGDVQVEGVTSEIALNTMSGDVRVMRTGGDLTSIPRAATLPSRVQSVASLRRPPAATSTSPRSSLKDSTSGPPAAIFSST